MTAELLIAFMCLLVILSFGCGYALGARNESEFWQARIDRMRKYYVGAGMRDW